MPGKQKTLESDGKEESFSVDKSSEKDFDKCAAGKRINNLMKAFDQIKSKLKYETKNMPK